jgi:hypothetical protein
MGKVVPGPKFFLAGTETKNGWCLLLKEQGYLKDGVFTDKF